MKKQSSQRDRLSILRLLVATVLTALSCALVQSLQNGWVLLVQMFSALAALLGALGVLTSGKDGMIGGLAIGGCLLPSIAMVVLFLIYVAILTVTS